MFLSPFPSQYKIKASLFIMSQMKEENLLNSKTNSFLAYNLTFKSANWLVTMTFLIMSLFLYLPGATEYNNETKTEPTLRF